MFSRSGLSKEEVGSMIQAVRQEFTQFIYGLEYKNQMLEEKNKLLEQELIRMKAELNGVMHNHFVDIELKINSFMKVWNPVVQSNIDRIKDDIIKDTDNKVSLAIQTISEQNNVDKIKKDINEEINGKINKLKDEITDTGYRVDLAIKTMNTIDSLISETNQIAKVENFIEKTNTKLCSIEHIINQIDTPVCLGYIKYGNGNDVINPIFAPRTFLNFMSNNFKHQLLIENIVTHINLANGFNSGRGGNFKDQSFWFELSCLTKIIGITSFDFIIFYQRCYGLNNMGITIDGNIILNISREDIQNNPKLSDANSVKIEDFSKYFEEIKQIKKYCEQNKIDFLANVKKITTETPICYNFENTKFDKSSGKC